MIAIGVAQAASRSSQYASIIRDRDLEIILNRAARDLDGGNTLAGLTALQHVLDIRADTFIWSESIKRPVSARHAASVLLTSQPDATRRRYEELYGLEARQLLADARRQRNWDQIDEVIRRFFHTAAGFEALDLRAARWLDRGHVATAARCWELLATDPSHQSRRTPALILKAAVALRQAGQSERADKLLRQYPSIVSRIAGMPFHAATILDTRSPSRRRMLSTWYMAFGDETNNGDSDASPPEPRPVWRALKSIDPRRQSGQERWEEARQGRPWDASVSACHGIVVADQLILRDGTGLRSLDPRTGTPLWHWRGSGLAPETLGQFLRAARIPFELIADQIDVQNSLLGMISSDGRRVFVVELFRLKPPDAETHRIDPNLLRRPFGQGLMLNREAAAELGTRLLAFDAHVNRGRNAESVAPLWTADSTVASKSTSDPESASGQSPAVKKTNRHDVLGAPLVIGERLYVVTVAKQQVNLVTLDASTGRAVHEQPIGLAGRDASTALPWLRFATAYSPVFSAGVLVCPTPSHALVGIDLVRGELMWSFAATAGDDDETNSTRRGLPYQTASLTANGILNLPLIQGRRVAFMPSDAEEVYCVDLFTGEPCWPQRAARTESDLYVAAATDRTVMLVGQRFCRGLSLETGTETWRQTLGPPAGHGFRSGARYFVPLKSGRVATLDINSGHEISLALGLHPTPFGVSPSQLGFNVDGPLEQSTSAASASRDGTVRTLARQTLSVGNLIPYRDYTLSVSSREITAFRQAAARLEELTRSNSTHRDAALRSLEQCELQLSLGLVDEAEKTLRSLLAHSLDDSRRRRGESLLREVLASRVASEPTASPELINEWDRLARTPADRARMLLPKIALQTSMRDWNGSLQSAHELASLYPNRFFAAEEDPELWRPTYCWAAGFVRELTNSGDVAGATAAKRDVELAAKQALTIGTETACRRFLEVHGWTLQAAPVRDLLAQRLLDQGRFQEAELLWLTNRESRDINTAARAAARLVQLWDRHGLYVEAGRMLLELQNRFADATCVDGMTGADFARRFHGRSDTRKAVRAMQFPDWPITNVQISSQHWLDSDPMLANIYKFHRGYRAMPEGNSYHLLNVGRAMESRIAVVDRHVGAVKADIKLSNSASYMSAGRSVTVGHLTVLNGFDQLRGLSVLDLHDGRPLWTASFASLNRSFGSTASGRIGFMSQRYCVVQTKHELLCLDSATGRLRWLRSDVDPTSGVNADRQVGLIGDDSVVLLFGVDHEHFTMHDTETGAVLRRGQLPVNLRYPIRVFGRKVFFVDKSTPENRVRLWDPLTDRTEMDEPASPLIFSCVTANGELAYLTNATHFRIVDVKLGIRRVNVELNPAWVNRLKQIQVFRDTKRYYLNLIRPLDGQPGDSDRQDVRPLTDVLIPASHIRGDLIAIDADSNRILWRRSFVFRTVLRPDAAALPFLITGNYTRVSRSTRRNPLMLEIIDAATGATLGLRDDFSLDQFVRTWYDPETGHFELHGVDSRIDLDFSPITHRLLSDDIL